MGLIYQKIESYLDKISPDQGIVEIGSDRWEGSTRYLAELADRYSSMLYTVDINPEATNRLQRIIPTDLSKSYLAICACGEDWAAHWAEHGRTIKVLYLDNFDWNWDVEQVNNIISQQQEWYQTQGLEFSNLACQIAHMKQFLLLEPFMASNAIVCIDDTYLINGTYTGKGAAIVVYLLSKNWQVCCQEDNGIILKPGCKT